MQPDATYTPHGGSQGRAMPREGQGVEVWVRGGEGGLIIFKEGGLSKGSGLVGHNKGSEIN